MVLWFIFTNILGYSYQTSVGVLGVLRLCVHKPACVGPAGVGFIVCDKHIGFRQLLGDIDAFTLREKHIITWLVPERATDTRKAHTIDGLASAVEVFNAYFRQRVYFVVVATDTDYWNSQSICCFF